MYESGEETEEQRARTCFFNYYNSRLKGGENSQTILAILPIHLVRGVLQPMRGSRGSDERVLACLHGPYAQPYHSVVRKEDAHIFLYRGPTLRRSWRHTFAARKDRSPDQVQDKYTLITERITHRNLTRTHIFAPS